ncbi:MAG: lipopolysaccharide biosynthesis protein [Leptolyngbya sp. IPPAS B-1204]|nr:MAG: lipopolysaccharide biosynthesis protein [Leptolyngbya sp. IPPAS B-1204]
MLIHQFRELFSNRFLQNVGWLGAAELINRVFRLGTTVTLARLFTTQDYGLMAILYTAFDFATVFTLRGGIGAKLIQADKQDVDILADTAFWINVILCGFVFVIQCAIAFPIAQFYNNQQLVLPLCVAASVYLMSPFYIVHSALIERENRLKVIALCTAVHSILNNLAIVAFTLLGWGIWAIVWAMVLTTPIWIVITWRNQAWRPPRRFQLEQWQNIVNFGKNLLGVELLNKLRGNFDYLVVGRFLGVEALGLYYFAFNAGLGISMNVINTFMSALYPHICEVRHQYDQFRQRYYQSLKKVAIIAIPLILIQSLLASFYVPIIFGERWVPAIPILIMICLSVIPRIFSWATYLLLNAIDKTHITLYVDIGFTVIFAASILIAVQVDLYWVAAAVLFSHLIILPIFAVLGNRYGLTERLHFSSLDPVHPPR